MVLTLFVALILAATAQATGFGYLHWWDSTPAHGLLTKGSTVITFRQPDTTVVSSPEPPSSSSTSAVLGLDPALALTILASPWGGVLLLQGSTTLYFFDSASPGSPAQQLTSINPASFAGQALHCIGCSFPDIRAAVFDASLSVVYFVALGAQRFCVTRLSLNTAMDLFTNPYDNEDPHGMSLDPTGSSTVLVTDAGNNVIQSFVVQQGGGFLSSIFAGGGSLPDSTDASSVQLQQPHSIAVVGDFVYFTELVNNRLRKYDTIMSQLSIVLDGDPAATGWLSGVVSLTPWPSDNPTLLLIVDDSITSQQAVKVVTIDDSTPASLPPSIVGIAVSPGTFAPPTPLPSTAAPPTPATTTSEPPTPAPTTSTLVPPTPATTTSEPPTPAPTTSTLVPPTPATTTNEPSTAAPTAFSSTVPVPITTEPPTAFVSPTSVPSTAAPATQVNTASTTPAPPTSAPSTSEPGTEAPLASIAPALSTDEPCTPPTTAEPTAFVSPPPTASQAPTPVPSAATEAPSGSPHTDPPTPKPSQTPSTDPTSTPQASEMPATTAPPTLTDSPLSTPVSTPAPPIIPAPGDWPPNLVGLFEVNLTFGNEITDAAVNTSNVQHAVADAFGVPASFVQVTSVVAGSVRLWAHVLVGRGVPYDRLSEGQPEWDIFPKYGLLPLNESLTVVLLWSKEWLSFKQQLFLGFGMSIIIGSLLFLLYCWFFWQSLLYPEEPWRHSAIPFGYMSEGQLLYARTSEAGWLMIAKGKCLALKQNVEKAIAAGFPVEPLWWVPKPTWTLRIFDAKLVREGIASRLQHIFTGEMGPEVPRHKPQVIQTFTVVRGAHVMNGEVTPTEVKRRVQEKVRARSGTPGRGVNRNDLPDPVNDGVEMSARKPNVSRGKLSAKGERTSNEIAGFMASPRRPPHIGSHQVVRAKPRRLGEDDDTAFDVYELSPPAAVPMAEEEEERMESPSRDLEEVRAQARAQPLW